MDYRDSHRALQDRFDTRRLADRLASVAGDDVVAVPGLHRGARHVLPRHLGRRRAAAVLLQGRRPRASSAWSTRRRSPSRSTTATACSSPSATSPRTRWSACSSSTSPTARGCGSTARRPSTPTDPLVADFPGAKLVVRVRARAVFPNCRRYVHTHGPAERSVFVPVEGEQPPVPGLEARRVVRRHPARRATRRSTEPTRARRRSRASRGAPSRRTCTLDACRVERVCTRVACRSAYLHALVVQMRRLRRLFGDQMRRLDICSVTDAPLDVCSVSRRADSASVRSGRVAA